MQPIIDIGYQDKKEENVNLNESINKKYYFL